jgi:hypothetical protein
LFSQKSSPATTKFVTSASLKTSKAAIARTIAAFDPAISERHILRRKEEKRRQAQANRIRTTSKTSAPVFSAPKLNQDARNDQDKNESKKE